MIRSHELKAACEFCRFLQHKSDCFSVFEDRSILTFLDGQPLFPGHCLLIPKSHVERVVVLPDSLINLAFAKVRLLAKAVREAMEVAGSLVAINARVSQSFPHLHVLIVPWREGDGLPLAAAAISKR